MISSSWAPGRQQTSPVGVGPVNILSSPYKGVTYYNHPSFTLKTLGCDPSDRISTTGRHSRHIFSFSIICLTLWMQSLTPSSVRAPGKAMGVGRDLFIPPHLLGLLLLPGSKRGRAPLTPSEFLLQLEGCYSPI